jgi:Beta-mannanase
MKKYSVLLILSLSLNWLHAQTFSPIADTDSQSDVTAGTNTTLNSSQWCHLFLRFDLSSVTDKISSAKLRLYQVNPSDAYTLNVNQTSTDTWSEGNTKPTTGNLITATNPSNEAGYKEVDITGFVQNKLLQTNKIISLSITTNLGSWISFYSRENNNNKPQLVITTTTGTTYNLTISATNGAVSKSPDRAYYETNTTVTLTAAPSGGCYFSGWSCDTTSTDNPLTITMDKNKSITANFPIIITPADTVLIDTMATNATVKLWKFLCSNYGKKMLTGCWTESQFGGNNKVVSCSGKYPAIWGQDMNSWYASRTDQLWNQTWQENINGFKTAWERGQILQVNWHWSMVSSKVNGAYTRDAWGKEIGNSGSPVVMMTDQQWADIVTPGTALYNAMIEDIDYHVVNFLKKIVDSNGDPIPIIFRPLHEIDGGWFWWTCKSDPSKTVQLYKILQDRIMNYHQMHNLIWVWNNGGLNNQGSWPPFQNSEYAARKAYYPGDTFCDIAGIDLYGFDPVNRGTYAGTGKTYRDAWNTLKAITTSKMLALCEAEAVPDPTKCFSDADYAPWLYVLPWYSENYYDEYSNKTIDLCTWNNTQFNNPNVVNKGVFEIATSAKQAEADTKSIRIFPNPFTSGNVKIKLTGFDSKAETYVSIYNVLGRSNTFALKYNHNDIEVNRSYFLPGIYFINVQSGMFSKNMKLIVE